MIRPCFDLQGGEVVQLIQGETLALREPVEAALLRFPGFPLVHVIDLDAAKGEGSNASHLSRFTTTAQVRFGGGVRSLDAIEAALEAGAHQVIVGSAAFREDGVQTEFLAAACARFGRERLVVAMDLKGERVAVAGWCRVTELTAEQALPAIEPYCSACLCTHVDREGRMEGADVDLFFGLQRRTELQLIAAGGITTMDEVDTLLQAGIEVALGMALYTGRLPVDALKARITMA